MIDKFYIVLDTVDTVLEKTIYVYHIRDYYAFNHHEGDDVWIDRGGSAGVSVELGRKLVHFWNTRFGTEDERRFFVIKEEAVAYKEKDTQPKLFTEIGAIEL